MRILLLFLSLSVITGQYSEKFENWVSQYKYNFNNKKHYYDVLKKWMINDEYIDYVNNDNRTYKLGHNQFSGMDEFDFIQYIIGNRIIKNRYKPLSNNREPILELPTQIDWREYIAVTPVKDQGQCGSCWAFSTTGALEGVYAINHNKLVSFSEQELIDCDNFKNGGKNHGCNGGIMDNAFQWIENNGGLCTEEDYPYISSNGQTQKCQKTCRTVSNSTIQKWVDVEATDYSFMTALNQQPVSVAIQADQREFQLYSSGVYTAKCGTTLDHGVLTVGYDSQDNQDYYILKNSWGITWGEQGYIKLGRGPQYNDGQGQCGILLEASYPVL